MDMPTNDNNDNGGHPPSDFQSSPVSSNQGSDSGDTEDDQVSPPTVVDDSIASIAQELSPNTPELRSLIQDLLQGDRTLEIPDAICIAFNATPDGPKYTCSLFKGNGQRCTKSFIRLDRLKHHLQGHLGITPYSCMDYPKPTVEPKCGRLFSSIAARATHAKNKGEVVRVCGTSVLPKNFARHRTTCSTCSDLYPVITRHSNL